jgi:hypothetical protein
MIHTVVLPQYSSGCGHLTQHHIRGLQPLDYQFILFGAEITVCFQINSVGRMLNVKPVGAPHNQ